eukprot:6206143-Pleurochrysis_carterae.AAC.3
MRTAGVDRSQAGVQPWEAMTTKRERGGRLGRSLTQRKLQGGGAIGEMRHSTSGKMQGRKDAERVVEIEIATERPWSKLRLRRGKRGRNQDCGANEPCRIGAFGCQTKNRRKTSTRGGKRQRRRGGI